MAIVLFRTVILFVTLLILMRILGKRQMGELELSELVVSVLVADLASMPLQDIGIPLMNGLIPIVVLFCCELIISDAMLKSIKLRRLLCGKPCLLVKDGKIQQEEMKKCRFTVDELTEELRGRDITDISKVKFAILETDGTFNAILQPGEMPVTAAQMGVQATDDGYAVLVVEEGRLMSENLKLVGRNEAWLEKELQRRGVKSVRDVYALIVFSATGKVYFQKREDADA
ncbi:MAG: DUF421 domain-containing protein [Oscillospiraceae bacterium]